jgi:hypothetical protein
MRLSFALRRSAWVAQRRAALRDRSRQIAPRRRRLLFVGAGIAELHNTHLAGPRVMTYTHERLRVAVNGGVHRR